MIDVFRNARRLVVSITFLGALSLSTALLAALPAGEAHRLVLASSTNLHRLGEDPLRVLVASILWGSPAGFVTLVLPTALLLGTVEWRIGSWRALVVVMAGHVGATLLAALGLVVGIHAGMLAPTLADSVDVGPSYATFALVAYAAVLLNGLARSLIVATIGIYLVAVVFVDRDFTSFGHVFAAVIGLTLALAGLGRPEARRRRSAIAVVVVALLVAPLTGWVEVSDPSVSGPSVPAAVAQPASPRHSGSSHGESAHHAPARRHR